jgi:PST family polysaccharide transporter
VAEGSPDLAARVKRAIVWSTVNNLLLRFGNLGLGIVLARLLAPEDFGVFAVALTLQNVLLALADLGLAADLIRSGNIEARAASATTLTTASGVVFAVVMCVAAGPFASALGSPDGTDVVRVISLTLVLAGMSVVPYAIMQRDFRQPEQTALGLIGLVLDLVVTVGLVLLGMGAMALAISRVVSQSVTTAVQFGMVRQWPRFGWDRATAAELLRFGVPLAAANLVYVAILSLPNALVGSMMGPVALGFFLLAFNISSWPLNAMGAAVRAVALPAFGRLRDPDRKAEGFAAAVAVTPAMVPGIRWAGLAGAGWSNAAVAGLVIVPAYLWLSRRYRVQLGALVRRISLSLVAAVPATVAGMLAVRTVDNRFLACAFGATAATALYAAVMFRPVRRWMAELMALKEHASEAAPGPEPTAFPDERQLSEQRA